MGDGTTRIEILGTAVCAVHNRVTTIKFVHIVKIP